MEENIFQSGAHQGEHDYIHDDTFQILDTNDYDVPEKNTKKTDSDDKEMMDTMDIFNERLDEVDCGCGVPKEIAETVIVAGIVPNDNANSRKDNSRKNEKHSGTVPGMEYVTPDELTEDNIVEGMWENEQRDKKSAHKHHSHKKGTDDKADQEQGSEFITEKSVCSKNL